MCSLLSCTTARQNALFKSFPLYTSNSLGEWLVAQRPAQAQRIVSFSGLESGFVRSRSAAADTFKSVNGVDGPARFSDVLKDCDEAPPFILKLEGPLATWVEFKLSRR